MTLSKKNMFRSTHGIVPALDLEVPDDIKRVVEQTTNVDGVVGYKIGLTGVLHAGLANAVRELRDVTDLPLIYDHQKAGADVPDMADKFSATCKNGGVDALILFPLAGPRAVTGFVKGALRHDLLPIVGGDLPFPDYNASGGGYVIDNALDLIFKQAIAAGARHFVVPGNTAVKVEHHAAWLREAVDNPALFIPGIGALGGSIDETFSVAKGCDTYAVIGRAIYAADDPYSAACKLAEQALRFV